MISGTNGISQKHYLVVFAQSFEEFRLPELESVAELLNIKLCHKEYSLTSPYCLISVDNEDHVKLLLDRCMLVQFIMECWVQSPSRDHLRSHVFPDHYYSDVSFNILLHSFGKRVSIEEKIDLIESIEHLPLSGVVNCSKPEEVFYICEAYKPHEPEPHDVYFGRLIGRSNRHLIDKFSVKKRLYIGRTTMDAQLSFIQANLAQISSGDMVYDPFVGTGSLLIPGSYHGAYTTGSDIDIKALKGWGKSAKKGEVCYNAKQSIEGNMISYEIQGTYLGSFCSNFVSPLLRPSPLFDVIVTDPPYGIREAALKPSEDIAESQCSLSRQYLELLNFAARSLVVGGRLVYWLPIIRDLYDAESVPLHPALKLLHNCEQVLNKKSSRRLIVMKKTINPELDSEETAYIPSGVDDCHRHFREIYFSPAT